MPRTAEGTALAILARYIETEVRNGATDRDAAAALKEMGVPLCVLPVDMARGNLIGLLVSALLDELRLTGEQRLACLDVAASQIEADRTWMCRARRRERKLN